MSTVSSSGGVKIIVTGARGSVGATGEVTPDLAALEANVIAKSAEADDDAAAAIAARNDAQTAAADADADRIVIEGLASSLNGPLLTSRLNSLMGTSDTFTVTTGQPSAASLVIAANRAYFGSAIDVGTDIAAGVVIDAWFFDLILDATATSIKIYVYSANTANAGINTAPPHIAAGAAATSGGAWTIEETIVLTPAAAGLVTDGVTRSTGTFPTARSSPIVTTAGKSYAAFADIYDAGGNRLRGGYGYVDKTGETRQRFIGWFHATAAAATWSNPFPNQKIALRAGTKSLADVLDLQDYIASADARILSLEQQSEIDRALTVHKANVAALLSSASLYPIAADNGLSFWGDSATDEQFIAAGSKSVDICGDFITGDVINNFGIGGQTAAQVDARVAVASADLLNDYSFLWSAGNFPAGYTTSDQTAALKATMDTTMGRFGHTRYMVSGPHTAIAGSRTFAANMKMRRLLKATYGAKSWSPYDLYLYASSRSGADRIALTNGNIPPSLTADNTHFNEAGARHLGLRYGWFARALIGGTPYVHPDIFGIKNGQAVDSAIGSPRVLGSPVRIGLWNTGNKDIVRIDPATGALTRGAGVVDFDVRDVYVEALHRKGDHIGRITLVRQMDGTDPSLGGVGIDSAGASVLGSPGFAGVDNTSKKWTVVMCARLRTGATGGVVGPLAALFVQDRSFRFIPQGASTGIAAVTAPQADQPGDYNMYYFTIDTTSGVVRCQGAVNDKTAATAAPTTDAPIFLANIVSLFMSNGFPLNNVDIKSLWFGTESWDFTNPANRQKFATGATNNVPRDIGASGQVDSTLPFLYMFGRPGDFILGVNHGTGGDLYPTPWTFSGFNGLIPPPAVSS